MPTIHFVTEHFLNCPFFDATVCRRTVVRELVCLTTVPTEFDLWLERSHRRTSDEVQNPTPINRGLKRIRTDDEDAADIPTTKRLLSGPGGCPNSP